MSKYSYPIATLAGVFITGLVAMADSSAFLKQGGEYSVAGKLPGDQVSPRVALDARGGLVVWEDNVTDGDGSGISAQWLDNSLSPYRGAFRVNQTGVGDQQSPQVALIKEGGAVVVWEGGPMGDHDVFARFLTATNTFLGDEIRVNSYVKDMQIDPVVAVLDNGQVVVAWSSYGQDGDMLGVYAQRLSSTGQKLGDEFQINQTTTLNQRTPSITSLSGGGFAIAWISEALQGRKADGGLQYGISVIARTYDANGIPITDEAMISQTVNVCANPFLTRLENNVLMAAWGQKDVNNPTNSWDVYGRVWSPSSATNAVPFIINSNLYGDQYGPRLTSMGSVIMAVWTSVGQDTSWEGVFGRFVSSSGAVVGNEFQVNTTFINKQFMPSVASDGTSRFLAVWSSFSGGVESFDVMGQRYTASDFIGKPAPPFMSALSQSRISITWKAPEGFDIKQYELLIDGSSQPLITTNTQYVLAQLAPKSTHSVKILCELANGIRSPYSDAAVASTWDEDLNGDGLPDDWQRLYWGDDSSKWPAGNVDSDNDGATNYQEFLAGTDPTDAKSVLRASIASNQQGSILSWNTVPGSLYQVQFGKEFGLWKSFGQPRLAAGTTDSLPVFADSLSTFFRVIRLR